jgi:hypothetical protein
MINKEAYLQTSSMKCMTKQICKKNLKNCVLELKFFFLNDNYLHESKTYYPV